MQVFFFFDKYKYASYSIEVRQYIYAQLKNYIIV